MTKESKELLAWIGESKAWEKEYINRKVGSPHTRGGNPPESTREVWENVPCYKYKNTCVIGIEFDTSAEAEEYSKNINELYQIAVSYSVKAGNFRFARGGSLIAAIDQVSVFVFISVRRDYAEKMATQLWDMARMYDWDDLIEKMPSDRPDEN